MKWVDDLIKNPFPTMSEMDRLLEIADRMEYLCMVEYPCEERHCPERGVDYVVHCKTCPWGDEWQPE